MYTYAPLDQWESHFAQLRRQNGQHGMVLIIGHGGNSQKVMMLIREFVAFTLT